MRNGLSYEEAGKLGGEKSRIVIAEITKRRKHEYHLNPKLCLECNKVIEYDKKSKSKFCSRSCAATFNNTGRDRHIVKRKDRSKIIRIRKVKLRKTLIKSCERCKVEFETLYDGKFCSQSCNVFSFQERIRLEKFKKIENGDTSFSPQFFKLYLIRKYGEKCMECGWNERNIVTNKVPIELEHIDGHSENNSLSNLKLICPNCHSLTPTYKALNVGNGRFKRRERYKDGKSF